MTEEKSGDVSFTSSFGQGCGCALMIIAAGMVLVAVRWASAGFPQFWK